MPINRIALLIAAIVIQPVFVTACSKAQANKEKIVEFKPFSPIENNVEPGVPGNNTAPSNNQQPDVRQEPSSDTRRTHEQEVAGEIRLIGQGDSFDCNDPAYANVKKVKTFTLHFSDGTQELCKEDR